jgi:hypothetical protein
LAIAVDGQGFAGEDFDLVAVFLSLWGKVNDLAGETAVSFGEGRDLFEFRGVRSERQSSNY